MSIMFNEICINEEMLPKYIYISTDSGSWSCRINRLHLYRGVRIANALVMILDQLMPRLPPCSFGECGVPFYCHCSQVHSDPVSYLWVKLNKLCAIKWLMLNCDWYMVKKKSSGLFKNVIYKMCLQTIYIYPTYMYKQNLALNNQHWLMCHKTKPNIFTQPLHTNTTLC